MAQRILMLSRVLPHHSIGGMQAIAWDLARAFVQAGCLVTIVTSHIEGQPSSFSDSGVRIETIPGTHWQRSGRRWWTATLALFQTRLSEHCDIVLSVSAGAFGLLKMRKDYPHIKFCMQAHGTSFGEVISKLRSRRFKAMLTSIRNALWICKDMIAYRKFDAIVAVGPRVFDDLQGLPYRWVLPRAKVHLILNGIDTTLFRPNAAARRHERQLLGVDAEQRVIISASRLHAQKGIGSGIRAFSGFRKKFADARYVIIGEGPERNNLVQLTVAEGVNDTVIFLGGLAREKLASVLCAGDVMLFTSARVEGLALNVLEALAVGLPAVLSQHLFEPQLMGATVIPVDANSIEQVTVALENACRIGVSETSQLPPHLSLIECVRSYLQLFEEIGFKT